MTKVYVDPLECGPNLKPLWNQGDVLRKRVTIITGNRLFSWDEVDQNWFWSSRWIEMEGETEQALAHGDFEDFDNVDDLFDDMNREED